LTAHGLIDTTEMYLRTVFELEEEGIVPLRARIAERLSQTGPTVSQTVARMERDGLLELLGYPVHCPHGNLIPGLDELGLPEEARARHLAIGHEPAEAMTEVAGGGAGRFVVRRISEQVQSDAGLMLRLKHIGIQPGREVTLVASHDGVRVTCEDYSDGRSAELPRDVAVHVFVARQ
jgi:DtxR family Mn-dependent transcriptional regulator